MSGQEMWADLESGVVKPKRQQKGCVSGNFEES